MPAKIGRRSKSHIIGTKVVFDLPLYVIRYQAIASDDAKKTFHDGKRLHRLSEMTISHGMTVYEKDFERCKEDLSKRGYKKITAQQMTADLPRFCPKCLQKGNPDMRLYDKVKSNRNKKGVYSEIKNIKYEIHYSHSIPRPHQCHIGYWTPTGYHLARGIDIKRMSPSYIVKHNGGYMEFDLPEKKMKRVKVL